MQKGMKNKVDMNVNLSKKKREKVADNVYYVFI